MTDYGTELEKLYDQRFPTAELAQKQAIWQVLCKHFFQRFVDPAATVVDVGAGYCEFINNIRARHKIAVDLNPDVRRFAAADVRVMNDSCTAMGQLESASVDVVFMSNFLEHLPSKQLVLDTFREAHRILKDDGTIGSDHIDAWQTVRNQVMHGELVSLGSEQKLEERMRLLTELMHRLSKKYIVQHSS